MNEPDVTPAPSVQCSTCPLRSSAVVELRGGSVRLSVCSHEAVAARGPWERWAGFDSAAPDWCPRRE